MDTIAPRISRRRAVNAINRRLQWAGGRRDEYPMFTGASMLA